MFFPQAGDVALILSAGVSGTLLKTMQRVLDKRAGFSHALISLGGDLWCEASPIAGVRISTTAEAFLSHPGKQTSLYRPPFLFQFDLDREKIKKIFGTAARTVEVFGKIEIETEAAQQWIRVALYYVGQRYNFLYLLAKPLRDERKFCSELVVGVLCDLHVAPFDKQLRRRPSAYAPVHIQTELAGSGWQCMDDDFVQYLNSYSEPGIGTTPDEARKSLINGMLMGTDAIISLCITHSLSIRDEVVQLGLLRSLPKDSNTPALTQQRATLQQAVIKAEEYLKRIDREGSIQRGAPWMGGSEQRQRLVAAKKELKATLRQAVVGLKRQSTR